MAIWVQNGTKTQNAYMKVHQLQRNKLKKIIGGEVLVLISQQGPQILSSLHFVPYWGLASIKALVPKSLKTSEESEE